jgi:hypothetical protein
MLALPFPTLAFAATSRCGSDPCTSAWSVADSEKVQPAHTDLTSLGGAGAKSAEPSTCPSSYATSLVWCTAPTAPSQCTRT